MLLLDKDDKGSSRASLLALDASSSTGSPTIVNVPPPTATRLSRRLILIHLLHLLLLAISLTILIVGVLRLDEDVSVSFANAAPVSSYLSLGFQIFFTAAVIILASLSRVAAVDSAIRHPASLAELDLRIQAWSGLASSLSNWRTSSRRSLNPFNSVFTTIPLYFIVAACLCIVMSSVIGVQIYVDSTVQSLNASVTNHMGSYLDPLIISTHDIRDAYVRDNEWSWPARKWDLDMFISSAGHSKSPGLQKNVVHDTPINNFPTQEYSSITVNSTTMNVQCSQVNSANIDIFLMPQSVTDMSHAIFVDVPNDDDDEDDPLDVWFNFSMPPPLYWDPNVPGLNFTTFFQTLQTSCGPNSHGDICFNPDYNNFTKVIVQPWVLEGDLSFPGHQQVVFVIATSDEDILIRDVDGSTGTTFNQSIGTGICKPDGHGHNYNDRPGPCKTVQAFVQVIGCSLQTTQADVEVTYSGVLVDTPSDPEPHQWDEFQWQSTSPLRIEDLFLTAFSPVPTADEIISNGASVVKLGYSTVEQLLTNLVSPSSSNNYSYLGLDALEGSLGALYASYIWKVWQLCDCPPWPMYSRQPPSVCQDFQLGAATGGWDAAVDAQVTMSETKATLKVILWRAVIGTACSALMCVLSFALLGTMTDRDKDTPLREARLVDGVRLMIDSSLPDTVKLVGVEGLKLRYGWNDDQSFRILDVRDENEKV
ncbi:hypothetical protein ARMGADRAFT_1087489 [Armillaria gallica]|uniref:Uncharacterized protein n=1 Tax=Armillaria gallica TaxID=47427 RepID=A0A2H3DAK3_ARMGA|nr:hypothetical protein ARMGADRAFT_1087489 [Armillaria gallica]